VNKRLSEVQNFSFKTCIELDTAVAEDSEEKVLAGIQETLLRSIYNRKEPSTDPQHIRRIARYAVNRCPVWSCFGLTRSYLCRYVRNQQKQITEHLVVDIDPIAAFRWQAFPWQTQTEADAQFDAQKAVLLSEEGNWQVAYDKEGRAYYWNTVTRRTTWNKPRDLR
jgi:hypothetical protein